MAEVEIRTERIDDVPLLMHQQRKMGIPEVLDEVIHPHGNWEGLSVGWLTTTWLSYILSKADHRRLDRAEQELQALTPPRGTYTRSSAWVARETGSPVWEKSSSTNSMDSV